MANTLHLLRKSCSTPVIARSAATSQSNHTGYCDNHRDLVP